jgi:acid phosphatase (class A)
VRLILLLLVATSVAGAQPAAPTKPARTSPWFNAQTIDFVALTPAPPAPGSEPDRQDMKEVLLAQRTRTSAQIQQAQADDKQEDIFIFASILGPKFNAAELPLTAALSQHLRDASAIVNPPLKLRFGRPRPFVASTQVHPVCEKTASNSFPSGHSMVGTLEALALTQILPERSPEVLHRLDQYTHNRVVCGVHYPSDIASSRIIASSLFGLIAASPAFQSELASARTEIRNHLGLPASSGITMVKEISGSHQ